MDRLEESMRGWMACQVKPKPCLVMIMTPQLVLYYIASGGGLCRGGNEGPTTISFNESSN